jgi:hypothetical protein
LNVRAATSKRILDGQGFDRQEIRFFRSTAKHAKHAKRFVCHNPKTLGVLGVPGVLGGEVV